MEPPVHILLVSGSLRGASTNSALVRTAAAVVPVGVTAEIYDGLAELPHFNPDDDAEGLEPPPAVAAMRAALARSDAVLFSTPEYAGALPGAFKNMLEWAVGSADIYALPVAWVNAAGPGRGVNAHDSLRLVLGYVGADLVENACRRIPVAHDAIGADGLIADAELRARLTEALGTLAAHAAGVRAASPTP